MLEWKEILNAHTLNARTRFICLRVDPDMLHTKDADDFRYMARVETVNGAALCYRENIPTIGEARAWCEAEYRTLLLAELAAVGG